MFYTYLIGWSLHNKWYYGARYAKNCDPSDLWVTYFTSSKYIKEFRNRMSKKPNDTSKYKEAALKRWANKEEREKLCKSMRVPKGRY